MTCRLNIRWWWLLGLALIQGRPAWSAVVPPLQRVFVIVMENHDWASIKGSSNAPYINNTLLPRGSHCEQYYTPAGLQPSLPNYLWLEAGTNFGIFDDNDPAVDHQSTTNHLVTLLHKAGIAWKSYQEDISGAYVPLTATNAYVPRHNPFVYFDDVTGTNNPAYQYGIAHIRPYSELAADLAYNTNVARYIFITPNLCDGMHDSCTPLWNGISQGDTWLANELPKIFASSAFQNGGALFIAWDEPASTGAPIGLILVSPLARGGGYFNNLFYTHSSLLRTLQETFGVGPLLRDAANATNLADLFCRYGFSHIERQSSGSIGLTMTGLVPGRTNLLQASPDMTAWVNISTNASLSNTFTFVDSTATNVARRFYRMQEAR